MKVSITSGKAEGPSKLNAFDNALLDAGIGDINLIKVSSIIPINTRIVELPEFPAGEMVNTVLSYVSSDVKGDLLSAVIAVAIGNDLGCVVEHSGINQDPSEIKEKAVNMVQYMMKIRNMEIQEIIVEQQDYRVKKNGAAVAALVYLN
jgi:arginine decarboxylase